MSPILNIGKLESRLIGHFIGYYFWFSTICCKLLILDDDNSRILDVLLENILAESKKYTSRSELAEKSPTAYNHAIKDKSIFSEMPWLVEKKKPDGWWKDKSKIMEEGKKYGSRTTFANGSYSAWKTARQKWLD